MPQEQARQIAGRFERWFEVEVVQPMADFQDPSQEWRRLFSELLGTFFLVLVAAVTGWWSVATPSPTHQSYRGRGRAGADGDGRGLLPWGRCPAHISILR